MGVDKGLCRTSENAVGAKTRRQIRMNKVGRKCTLMRFARNTRSES